MHSISSKNLNKRVILDMIRFTPGGISRAELARQMDLTRAAISTIIGDLQNLGVVQTSEEGPTTGGRKPVHARDQSQDRVMWLGSIWGQLI